ncbi:MULTISPECIES: NAD(P)-dependent oxidoreductase [unclassified Streptomyces]|uniref:NAD(P)-dependent oxidoreductase n=1 Tax=unclassified Streptomyces TaxID=2593676 RepID=UPI003451700A
MNIVVFGAGGRAGRQVVAEARRRGHRVTAVVRDPARHGDLAGAHAVAGDVTDASSVERVAAGHDAAVSAAVDLSVPAHDFFTASSRALSTGLAKADVRRLVVVGLASVLPGASGVPLMDEPGYPGEYRSFCLGHAAGLDALRAGDLDWVYAAPEGDFDHDGTRTGRYALADHGDPAGRISYADFAIALLDELDAPRHHRATVSVRAA